MKKEVCNCEAYSFPHRLDSKACRELYNNNTIEEDYRVQIMKDFDRTEAQAINLFESRMGT